MTNWARARCFIGAAVLAAGLLSTAGTAWGADDPATTDASVQTCTDPVLQQPFAGLKDKDTNQYVLAPGGSFEDQTSGWSLDGGASVVLGNEPLQLNGAGDGYSLNLPPGATATSPTMCVDLHYPHMRFLAIAQSSKAAGLDVEVVYPTAADAHHQGWEKAATIKGEAKNGWRATDKIKIHPDRGGKLSGWRPVALRFSADDDNQGSWMVDDVFVDPRCR
jgi:hypothetical protein